jgi:hypothetical protein
MRCSIERPAIHRASYPTPFPCDDERAAIDSLCSQIAERQRVQRRQHRAAASGSVGSGRRCAVPSSCSRFATLRRHTPTAAPPL